MRVGVIKEIKDKEQRVALTPVGATTLCQAGHTVLVQAGAGLGAGFADAQYVRAGATVVDVDQAWKAELVLKVKEPLASEYHTISQTSCCAPICIWPGCRVP
jgi:alanine dehydrogenase